MISDKDTIEIESILALIDKKIAGLMHKTESIPTSDEQTTRLRTVLSEIKSIHTHQDEQFDELSNG